MPRASVKWDFGKMEKGFKKTEAYQNLVDIGAAAIASKLSGGFKKIRNQRQGSWRDLDPAYLKRKRRRGLDTDKWGRTGRLLKAIHNNEIVKTGTKKGFNYRLKVSRRVTLAIYMPRTFGKHLQKKPNAAMQKRIFSLLDYRRPFFRWDRPDLIEVEKSVASAIQKVLNKSGVGK